MHKYQTLTVEQRLRLVEDIWDSIAIDASKLPVTAAQKRELDKRLRRLTDEGPDGIDARAYISELKNRL